MASDPILTLAKQRIIKASADLEVQISSVKGGGPAVEILRRLRERAAESLAALVFLNLCDPADVMKAQTLQNEVKRYDEWFGCMKEIIAEGIEHDEEISADEREELLDVLTGTPQGEREAIELGLVDEIPRDN